MKLVKAFNESAYVYLGKGKFDDWCVYLSLPDKKIYAPKDGEYFNFFIAMAKIYGNKRIYNDFCQIYDLTTDKIDAFVLEKITDISQTYKEEDKFKMDIWLTVVYLGMVAEENKKNAILKKRIKRLGIYQILFENFSAFDAANFSKGKKAKDLDKICLDNGF